MNDIKPYIFLALVFSLIMIYYLWLRRLRANVIDAIRKNCIRLRNIRGKVRSIRDDYNFFEPYQHAPYKDNLASLKGIVLALIFQYQTASRLRRNILYKLPLRLEKHHREFFYFLRYGRSNWFYARDREKNLENHLIDLDTQIKKALKKIGYLEKQPETTADRAKKIKDKVDQIDSTIARMIADKVWGKTLEDGSRRLRVVMIEANKIPANFHTTYDVRSKDRILTTIAVHDILEKIENSSEVLLKDVNDWKKLLTDCRVALTKTHTLFDELKNTATMMPTSLELTQERARIHTFLSQLSGLQSEFSKPTLEDVPKITLQANNLAQDATSLLTAFKGYEEQFKKLSDIISELFTRIQSLQAGFWSQAGQAKYPLRWDLSKGKIEQVIQVWEAIEPIGVLRTPQNVRADYDKLIQVQKELAELEKVYQIIIKQAKELRDGWENIKRVTLIEWINKTSELDEKTTPYSSENWDSKLQIRLIKVDALKLIQRAEQVVPRSQEALILESKITVYLDTLRTLIRDISSFEERQNNIELKYVEILEKELRAETQIKTTVPWVHAIIKEMKNWNLTTKLVKDIYELFNQGDELKVLIADRSNGRVDTKLQRIETWVKNVNDGVNTFIKDLSSELKTHEEEIKAILDSADQIGKIKDDEVSRARELVTIPTYSFDIPKVSLTGLEQSYEKIKYSLARRNVLSQSSGGLANTLKSVIDIVNDTRSYLRSAYALLEKAEQEFRRKWPPVSDEVIPEYERQLLADIEQDILFFRNQRQPASSFETEYIHLREKAKQVILGINEKLRTDTTNKKHYNYLENNIKIRLRTRIREQAALTPGFSLSPELYHALEAKGLSIVQEIIYDYINQKIDIFEVERLLQTIFQPTNTKINLHDFSIHTEGGPLFSGPVHNTGSISGRSDTINK